MHFLKPYELEKNIEEIENNYYEKNSDDISNHEWRRR